MEFIDYDILMDWIIYSKKYWKYQLLKQRKNRLWYLRVNLCTNGIMNTYLSHRLVAEKFIPNPENKPQINHKNWIHDDNRVENLEWVTASENTQHAYDTWLKKVTENHHFYTKHHKAIIVLQFDLKWNLINTYRSITFACKHLWIDYFSLYKYYLSNKIFLFNNSTLHFNKYE